jgi:FkbM family methyltransferase
MFALTSLSAGHAVELQRSAVASWQAAGLSPYSFNHPSEIAVLAKAYPSVVFAPVEKTGASCFGRHFALIKSMLDWAVSANAPVMILNSDIELSLAPAELQRISLLSDDGICCFWRYNHNGDRSQAVIETCGIDGFLFHGRHVRGIADSFLSMGQPWWDYWLPFMFISRDLPLRFVEFPAAFHRNHAQRWSWDGWHRCALEFDRFAQMLGPDRSMDACRVMASHVLATFQRKKQLVSQQPEGIRVWVGKRFSHPRSKIFLELGAHRGAVTTWLAQLPSVVVHAFEPDPRNRLSALPNVVVNDQAVSDQTGTRPFILSSQGWGQEWTYSSSLKPPKNHFRKYPAVSFGKTISVQSTTLDGYCSSHNIGVVDLVWAEIQGAEGEMIRGAQQTLSRTRYLYTAFSDEELYEGQISLAELQKRLPSYRVIEVWYGSNTSALLKNTALSDE